MVLRYEEVERDGFLCNVSDITEKVIEVNVVGDPLFRRRLSVPDVRRH